MTRLNVYCAAGVPVVPIPLLNSREVEYWDSDPERNCAEWDCRNPETFPYAANDGTKRIPAGSTEIAFEVPVPRRRKGGRA